MAPYNDFVTDSAEYDFNSEPDEPQYPFSKIQMFCRKMLYMEYPFKMTKNRIK